MKNHGGRGRAPSITVGRPLEGTVGKRKTRWVDARGLGGQNKKESSVKGDRGGVFGYPFESDMKGGEILEKPKPEIM